MNLLLPSVLKELYFKTSRLSRQVFWSVFVALNLVFAFHTAQFLWGNHDWMKVYGAFKLNQSFYTKHLIDRFFESNFMLPVANNLIGFFFFSLAAVWFCKFLRLPQVLWVRLSVALLFTLSPFVLTRMQYTYEITGIFSGVAACVFGFWLVLKAGGLDKTNQSVSQF